MFYVHEYNMIATLKRVIRNNVVDGHGQLVPEPACGLGVGFVRFVVDESAVVEGLAVLDVEEEEKETDETMGSGVTSSAVEF
jgi:hypothetical protein